MRSNAAIVSVTLLLLLSMACATGWRSNAAFDVALRTSRSVEVTVRGPVVSLLSDGAGADGPHERFVVSVDGRLVEIDHNLTLAGRVPVAINQVVTVRGQFEPDAGRPVIHYTHHATGGHQGGWIDSNGRRYD